MQFSKNTYNFKWEYLFIVYIGVYICFTWLTNTTILTDSYYYSAFGNQIGSDRVEDLIKMNHKFQWLGYIALPLVFLLKLLLLAGVIFIGLYLYNQKVTFNSCLKIILIAELSVIIANLTKLIYFIFQKPQTSEDIQFFYPLSITQLFNLKQLPVYLIYPLQQLNLFEVAYWLLIATGIREHIQKSFSQSFKIVASSYGVALVIWVLCVLFIQLQFT